MQTVPRFCEEPEPLPRGAQSGMKPIPAVTPGASPEGPGASAFLCNCHSGNRGRTPDCAAWIYNWGRKLSYTLLNSLRVPPAGWDTHCTTHTYVHIHIYIYIYIYKYIYIYISMFILGYSVSLNPPCYRQWVGASFILLSLRLCSVQSICGALERPTGYTNRVLTLAVSSEHLALAVCHGHDAKQRRSGLRAEWFHFYLVSLF